MADERFLGYAVLEDSTSMMLFGNRLRIYAERGRAGFDVAPMNGGVWERVDSHNQHVILHTRMLLGVIRELGGMVNDGAPAAEGPCPGCGDRGWFDDKDGNQVPCPTCRGPQEGEIR